MAAVFLVKHNRKEHFSDKLWTETWVLVLLRGISSLVCCLSSAELSKHKRYEIRMSVYNAVGEGPSSPPQEVFVGEAGMHVSYLWEEGPPVETCLQV